MTTIRKPNFLFIGPDKSGSTWLYNALEAHPQVFLPRAKELFFFDKFYGRGWRWYQEYFSRASVGHKVVAELSHDYLFSSEACSRIAKDLPEVKLMVCLREPVQRAFSAYLYMLKQGRIKTDFDAAICDIDELIDHGLYAKHLRPYLNTFKRDQLYVGIFDDLVSHPQEFFSGICNFLDIEAITLPSALLGRSLPAAKPRFQLGAGLARKIGWGVRHLGFPGLVGRIKSNRSVNKLLYEPYSSQSRPTISAQAARGLRDIFYSDIQDLDALLNTDFCTRWQYSVDARSSGS